MKKLLLFVTMAASLLFTQCKKEDSVSSAGKTVSMTVTAGPGSKTDITDAGAITWSAGDKLYVGDGSKYIGSLTLKSGAGSATGVFSGNVTLGEDVTGEKSFGFFYLGSKNYTEGDDALQDGTSTQATVSFASQNIYNNNGKLENASACHVGYGSAKGTVINDVVTDINVMLVSKVALAHFSFTKENSKEAYEGALTLKGDNIYNEMTVNFDGTFTGKEGSTTNGISLGNGHGERYVMLVPTGDATAQSLTFTGDNVSGTGEVPGLQANQFYGKDPAIAVTLTPTTIPVTSVTLDKTSLSLKVGEEKNLNATVHPDNATDPSVTWSSSATGVATVSDAGVVTAVAAGEATITVTTVDGNKTATCTVTVTAAHEYVDLGLSVKWATCNVGASKPEESGWYFMWGSTTNGGDSNCSWANCPGNGGNSSYNETAFNTWKSSNLTNNVLKPEVDAASVNWGGGWRMPTSAEWKELYDNTTSTWTTENGVNGYKFTSKTDNSKYIFLPAAGRRKGTDVLEAGSGGYYWSSSLYSSDPRCAHGMCFSSGGVFPQNYYLRNYGFSVRPVQ